MGVPQGKDAYRDPMKRQHLVIGEKTRQTQQADVLAVRAPVVRRVISIRRLPTLRAIGEHSTTSLESYNLGDKIISLRNPHEERIVLRFQFHQ